MIHGKVRRYQASALVKQKEKWSQALRQLQVTKWRWLGGGGDPAGRRVRVRKDSSCQIIPEVMSTIPSGLYNSQFLSINEQCENVNYNG
jgi:anti-sigma factor ChrR (cupin superfamily)